MTIDKQALREAAEKATRGPWEMERENIWFTDEDGYTKHLAYVQQGDDVDDKQDHYNTAFIAVANPATMLALLDENLQLQREKDAIEAVALALRDDMRQARELLEAAEKRNAEQREYYEGVIADGSKRIAELESKNANLRTIAHEQSELATRVNLGSINDAVEMGSLHKRIAELEAKLSKPVLLPKTNGYWTEQEKAYEEAITLAKRQVRLAGFNVEEM
ncbi:ead/Ea22-like family protein [Salmonella enterica]|nr:ead/Ea22-like family protein [Salmonella enterica]